MPCQIVKLKNDMSKMTTIFLDEVCKPFFKNRPWHGPTTDDRSDEFPDGRIPSNHSTYGGCECKHEISNTPKGKKSHVERSGERGGYGTSPKREMRCPLYTNTRCSTGQVSIATEVANPDEKNADHLVPPPGLPTEFCPFKRCQVSVEESVWTFLIAKT